MYTLDTLNVNFILPCGELLSIITNLGTSKRLYDRRRAFFDIVVSACPAIL